jgi:hypothetical protein
MFGIMFGMQRIEDLDNHPDDDLDDEMDDAFEIEVSWLGWRDERNGPRDTGVPRVSAQRGRGPTVAATDRRPPPSPVVARLTTRGRLLRTVAMGGLVVAALTVLLAAQNGVPAALATLATGTATTSVNTTAGARLMYLEHSVPWATLRLDGRQITISNSAVNAPTSFTLGSRRGAISSPVFPAFVLPGGRHVLDYTTDGLFPALHCLVSVPPAADDTCPPAPPPPPAWGLDGRNVRILDMGATLERLAPAQHAALLAATQDVLGTPIAPAIVDPGTPILAADGSVTTVAAPLEALPVAVLNRDSEQPLADYTVSCVTLCDSDPRESLGVDVWTLDAHAVVSWRYLGADGPGSSASGPAAPMRDDQHVLVTLAVAWHGHWEVEVPSQSAPTCLVGTRMLNRALAGVPQPAPGVSWQAYFWAAFAGQPPANGCVLAGRQSRANGPSGPNGSAASAPIVGPTLYLLYRFGLLVPVNAASRSLFPQLPAATSPDLALASQWGPKDAVA